MKRPLAVVGLVAVLGLTACGTPPWEEGGGSATPTPTTTTTTVPTPVPNDLSSGATERVLQAGAVTVTINYWSTLSMDKWTADALKPLDLSMSTTIVPDDGQKVYLQRAAMVPVPSGPDGTGAALEAQVDSATVSPGYLVLSPYSYSQTFTVGPVPAGTTSVALQMTYDFLVQSTPTSSEYAKQTVTDVITVAISG